MMIRISLVLATLLSAVGCSDTEHSLSLVNSDDQKTVREVTYVQSKDLNFRYELAGSVVSNREYSVMLIQKTDVDSNRVFIGDLRPTVPHTDFTIVGVENTRVLLFDRSNSDLIYLRARAAEASQKSDYDVEITKEFAEKLATDLVRDIHDNGINVYVRATGEYTQRLFQPGDVLLQVNGIAVANLSRLKMAAIVTYEKEIVFEIRRLDKTLELRIAVGNS